MPHSCIGNYMTYDTITVYYNWNCHTITIITINAFLKSLINDHSKTRNPFNKSIIYFSDGSTIQYKNYENFTNLLMHGKDFGMEAKYHFKNIKRNWRQYFNSQSFRGRCCSNIFDWRFTSYTKYCRSNTTNVLCQLFWQRLVFWDSKLCFYWE